MTWPHDEDAFALDDRSRGMTESMGEDPTQKASQIEVIRKWIRSHNYLTARTDDAFILRFLRTAKFSCESAKERIAKYCIARTSTLDGMPEWFREQDVREPKLREIIETGMCYPMPEPDKLGRIVIYLDPSKVADKRFDPVDIARAFYLVFDYVIGKYERSQVNGVRVIENASAITVDQLTYWTPDKLKKTIENWQGVFPLRVKRIDYYNVPKVMKVFIDGAMNLVKPKMQKRVNFHSDLEIPEHLTVQNMPNELGGDTPPWEEVKEHFIKDLENYQPEFDSLRICEVDDEKIPKKYVEGDSWGISGTYRTIQETC